MELTQLVAQALTLPSAANTVSWNLDAVLKLAFEAAVLVKANGGLTKEKNVELLLQVVKGVLDKLQSGQETSSATDMDTLKAQIDSVLPVVFSHVPHVDVDVRRGLTALTVRSVLSALSLMKSCSGCSGTPVLQQVEATTVASVVSAAASVDVVDVVDAAVAVAVAASVDAALVDAAVAVAASVDAAVAVAVAASVDAVAAVAASVAVVEKVAVVVKPLAVKLELPALE